MSQYHRARRQQHRIGHDDLTRLDQVDPVDATAWGSQEGWGGKQRGAHTDAGVVPAIDKLGHLAVERRSTSGHGHVGLPSSWRATCSGWRLARRGGKVLQSTVYAACEVGCGGCGAVGAVGGWVRCCVWCGVGVWGAVLQSVRARALPHDHDQPSVHRL